MRWRPHTEQPDFETTAILAFQCMSELVLLNGIWRWRNGQWVNESSDLPCRAREFWWMPEGDLLGALVDEVQP